MIKRDELTGPSCLTRLLIRGIAGMTEQINEPEWPTQMQIDRAKIARLHAALDQALAELHHHFGCDAECEKRHADKVLAL